MSFPSIKGHRKGGKCPRLFVWCRVRGRGGASLGVLCLLRLFST